MVCLNLNSFHFLTKRLAEALDGLGDSGEQTEPYEASINSKDIDKILLANTYFQTKEFKRCAHALKNCRSEKALFLRWYALFLSVDPPSNSVKDSPNNPELGKILMEMDDVPEIESSAFLLYLKGVVLSKKHSTLEAQKCFAKSVIQYPLNWSCWLELVSTLKTFTEAINMLESLKSAVSTNPLLEIMLLFFKITIHQEFFQQSFELYQDIASLQQMFPHFQYLNLQSALISYQSLDYTKAETIFDSIMQKDPYRLDDLDTFSNILYVMEKKSKLSFIAHFAMSVNKFRPETCCIVANYYSLNFDHERAIMYYKRALSLNPNCLSAWTLMGHEFVELKNTHAAIESYRRALEVNNKDFRAWYGLGQAYEVLEMFLYCLYYYNKACLLKPLDQRMWCALGQVYEKLGDLKNSIKHYKKAVSVNNNEVDLCLLYYKLGELNDKNGKESEAKRFFQLCIQDPQGDSTAETNRAKLFLAKLALKQRHYAEAMKISESIHLGDLSVLEEARAIARECRSAM